MAEISNDYYMQLSKYINAGKTKKNNKQTPNWSFNSYIGRGLGITDDHKISLHQQHQARVQKARFTQR